MKELGLRKEWVFDSTELSQSEWNLKVEKRMAEKQLKEWRVTCESNTKLQDYMKWDGMSNFKLYLNEIFIRNRDILVKLRSGVNSLRIEEGHKDGLKQKKKDTPRVQPGN